MQNGLERSGVDHTDFGLVHGEDVLRVGVTLKGRIAVMGT